MRKPKGRRKNTKELHALKLADDKKLEMLQALAERNDRKTQRAREIFRRPAFEGTGTVTIHVLYNDFLYQTFELNFDTGSSKMTEDNSANHP